MSVYDVVKHTKAFKVVLKDLKKTVRSKTSKSSAKKVSLKNDPKKKMKKVFIDLRKTVRENKRLAKETTKAKRVTIRLNKVVFKELLAKAKEADKVGKKQQQEARKLTRQQKAVEKRNKELIRFCDKTFEDNFVTEFGDSEFEINYKPEKETTKKWVKKQGK